VDRADRLVRILGAPFDAVRALAYFVLGVALLLDAIVQPGANVPELVAGLILLGLVPVEALVFGRRAASSLSAAAPPRPEVAASSLPTRRVATSRPPP
jgi:hypothetical protein